jgi:F-type H+/Na+-transporting ATPase subunit alpha
MNEFENYLEKNKEIGRIIAFSQTIAHIAGLPNLKIGETVVTESGKIGIVHGLKKNFAEVLIIEARGLRTGEAVARTGELFQIPVNKNLLGRIVNPLCQPIDGKGPIRGEKGLRKIEKTAPPFIERKRVKKSLETGVMVVDFLVPIGEGQRELVIGDAKTGKTTLPLQVLASQAQKGTVCIYVGIRKKDIAIRLIEGYLKTQGVFDQTIIVNATPDDSPTLSYLSPYSGISIAEYFKDQGQKVIIVFDDLTTHAKVYREISLLLKRPPGRDSYPGDIFHIHAALLERAGNFKSKEKEISITALPIAETLENDLSGYTQTNLMAMTDGHIFFDINAFRKGKRPAINAFLSVSRVGNQTKTVIEKNIATWVRKRLLEYERASEIAQFGTELTAETYKILEVGKRLETLFNQAPETTIPRDLQLILAGLLINGFWEDKSLKRMREEINKILEYCRKKERFLKLRERAEAIQDINHLKFLIKELMPEIAKIIL